MIFAFFFIYHLISISNKFYQRFKHKIYFHYFFHREWIVYVIQLKKYIATIEQEIYEEFGHWKNIHSILSQQIQQSPASEIDTISEENETINLSANKFNFLFKKK